MGHLYTFSHSYGTKCGVLGRVGGGEPAVSGVANHRPPFIHRGMPPGRRPWQLQSTSPAQMNGLRVSCAEARPGRQTGGAESVTDLGFRPGEVRGNG